MKAVMQIDPYTFSEFKGLLDELQRTLGVETPKLLRNAGRDLAWAALKVTPKSRPTQSMKAKGGGYWVVMTHPHTGRGIVFRGTKAQAERYSKFGTRKKLRPGFAKAGWLAALAKSGANISTAVNPRYGDYKLSARKGLAGLRIGNAIPFIEDLDNGANRSKAPVHILEKAMRIANNKMAERLDRMAGIIRKKVK